MPKSLPSAQYQALKRRAAVCPKSPAQREDATKALLQLLELPEWRGKTIYLKKKKVEGGEEQYLSKSRVWHDFITNKGHRESQAALRFMRERLAEPLNADGEFGDAAKELAEVLVDDRKLINVGREEYPVAGYYGGEADNVPLLRHKLRVLVGGFANRDTMHNAKQVVAADKPLSLWGHYPDPVYCCPARQEGQGPRFSDPATRKQAARAIYDYLSQKPPVPRGVAYMAVNSKGECWFGVRPKDAAISAETAKEQRIEFIGFFYDLCSASILDQQTDSKTREFAQYAVEAVGEHLEHGKDFPNSENLVKAFALLADVKPQEAPEQQGAAAQSSSAQSGVAVAMVDFSDPKHFHTTFSTPRAILKSLPPPTRETKNSVLRTSVRDGALHVEVVPPINDPVSGTRDPADQLTCRLIFKVGSEFENDSDPDVKRMAVKLKDVAKRSLENNRAITNHPGLHEALNVVSSARSGASNVPQGGHQGRREREPERTERRAQRPAPTPRARATNAAPSRRPVLGTVSPFNNQRFLLGRDAPQTLLDILSNAPDSGVLQTIVLKGESVYLQTVAPSPVPGGSRHGPADAATCLLLKAVADDYINHRDPQVKEMAGKLKQVAAASETNNSAIPNLRGLRQILAVLAGASQQARKGVVDPRPVENARVAGDANRSGARGRSVTTLYQPLAERPYATARNATARELLNMLQAAPLSHVLHTEMGRNKVVTSTRLPGAPRVKPEQDAPQANTFQGASIHQTRNLLWALVDDFRNSQDAAVKAALAGILKIVKASTDNKQPIPNTEALQDYLSTLASAA